MGKKQLTATVDELNEQKADLQQQIQDMTKKLEDLVKDSVDDLDKKVSRSVQDVQKNVDQLDKVKIEQMSCDKVATQADQRLAAEAAALRELIESLKPTIEERVVRAEEQLSAHVVEVDAATRNLFAEELESLCCKFDEEIKQVQATAENLVNGVGDTSLRALAAERVAIDAALLEARGEAAAAVAEAQRVAAEALQAAVEDQEKVDKKQDQKLKNAVTDIDYKFSDVEKDIGLRSEASAKALAEAVTKAAKELAELADQNRRRFEAVGEDIAQVRASFLDVENVPTRKLEWVIREAGTRLKVPTDIPEGELELPTYGSWQSPLFDAAGARNLRLEVRYFRATDPPAEDEHRGDLAVLLHAPPRTHIAVKLSIAGVSETFEHKFKENEPLCTRRMCFLNEQVDYLKGTLPIGVEVLECIYAFNKTVPPPEPPADGEAEPAEVLDSYFHIQRHVNNRVLDQVKAQLDYFRKRCIRRVEWRLEQASMMRRCFPRGAPMKSKEFDAAGIEGMFIMFYPSGYDSALEGWCSAFLHAPIGATLRCWLQVGPQKREINHTFDKEGHCGKANFLRWDEVADPDADCVNISLQVEEAHLDLHARMSHPPPPAAGCRSFAKPAPPLLPLGSTVKLQRTSDQIPEMLQETKVLPTLWATRNYHELAVKVDGLRPIKDARARQRPRSGVRRSPSSPMLR